MSAVLRRLRHEDARAALLLTPRQELPDELDDIFVQYRIIRRWRFGFER